MESSFSCSLCKKQAPTAGLCARCLHKVNLMLDDLFEFWDKAHLYLTPTKGSGQRSSEMSIGVNVSALSFITGHDILNLLWEWEKLIRSERSLTRPAHLRARSLPDEIQGAISFAQRHLDYSSQQIWFDDFYAELRELHSKGRAAAKSFIEKKKRIPCPGEVDGLPCNRMLSLGDASTMMEIFSCPRCKTEWTTLRLVAVAMSDPNADIWLDIEAIAGWLGISERQCRRIALKNSVDRRGRLYNLKQMRDAYATA